MPEVPTPGAEAPAGLTAGPTTGPEVERERGPLWWIIEWTLVIVVALVLAIGVRTYVVQTFFIPSGSMEPTLLVGDRILVLKVAYDFTNPAIGDVIVFRAPPSERSMCSDSGVQDLVKRIVGLPGQFIASRGNEILVNGKVEKQDWQHYAPLVSPIRPQLIPPNQYFVMGDNHPSSCDSRTWGTVPRSDIVGKVVLRIWPLSQFGTI